MPKVFTDLINRVGIIMILAFIMSKIKLIKSLVAKKNIETKDKLFLSIIFGIYGIIGTYIGIPVDGALANSRVIGVFVGGLLGGPLVGTLSGLIAGIHRWAIDINGFTTTACTISTILAGVLSGLLSKKHYKTNQKWLLAMLGGVLAETIQMILILIFAKPFSEALRLVKIIAVPVILLNSIGIAVFIAIIDSISKDQERAAAYQAQIALKIANRSFPYFRKGFNSESALEASKIIQEMTDIKAVAFTDKEKILSYVGIGEEYYKEEDLINNYLVEQVIETGDYSIFNVSREIDSNYVDSRLKSAIIVPLRENNETIGTLILYKIKENSITQVDLELALGLGTLFSTQITLSKLEHQAGLLAKAELKALQSQINPHFLFNSINTIAACTRTEPEKARELLMHLGTCFRKNLQQNTDDVQLQEEIEYIKSYIEIEKTRFGDKLTVDFNIPENIDCYLPPLMLQPIVENAINHGIFHKIEGGTVKIEALSQQEETILIVEDDGIGIKDELLQNLFINEKKNDSIGLINVNNRLKNKYGEQYGLEINSEYGKGTTVIMKIPKLQGGDFNVKVPNC